MHICAIVIIVVELFLIGILLTVVGLLILRCKDPHRERPLKIPLCIPYVFIIILTLLIGASAITDMENLSRSLLMLFTALPAYCFGVLWKKKPSGFTRHYDSFALTLQKLFQVVHDKHEE
jgi:amino acid transporter